MKETIIRTLDQDKMTPIAVCGRNAICAANIVQPNNDGSMSLIAIESIEAARWLAKALLSVASEEEARGVAK